MKDPSQSLHHMIIEPNDGRLLQLALDAAGLGAWSTDLELQELRWDARTRELLGHGNTPPSYESSFLQHVHHDDREKTNAIILEAITNKKPLDAEYRIVNPQDGTVVWIHARGDIMQESGRTIMAGTVQNVTSRRQAEDLQKPACR